MPLQSVAFFFKLVSDNFQYLVCMIRAKKMPKSQHLLFADALRYR